MKRRKGGHIYQSVEDSPIPHPGVLGPDYARGADLVSEFRACGAEYYPNSEIWMITPDREIGILSEDALRFIRADRILITVGCMERPVPFPGWTLPGVMNTGGGQVLLKSAGMVPSDGVVLAGLGPLMFLLAWQYAQIGVKVHVVLDMTPLGNYLCAIPYLLKAAVAGDYIRKGLSLKQGVKSAGVPIIRRVNALHAKGDNRLEAIEFRSGQEFRRIESSLLLTHFGFIPNSHLTRSLNIRHNWDERQICWRPDTDPWGNTSMEGVLASGDVTGIWGALAAELSGRLAAFEIACAVGKIDKSDRDQRARPIRKALRRDLLVRPFLETLFKLQREIFSSLDDEVIICRCEEVSAGEVRRAIDDGCLGPNQVKQYTRCGMGPCQGRQCGPSIEQLIASALGKSVDRVGFHRTRPPIKPVSLGQLAELEVTMKRNTKKQKGGV